MRLLGYRPSPRDRVGLGHPGHLATVQLSGGRVLPLPRPADDQSWQDCIANAIAIVVEQKTGVRPSRRWIYGLLRALIGELDQDGGGYIHDGFDALRDKGMPREVPAPGAPEGSALPYGGTPFDLEWRANENLDRVAYDQRWVDGAHRLLSTDDGLVRDVAAAIDATDYVVAGWRSTGPS